MVFHFLMSSGVISPSRGGGAGFDPLRRAAESLPPPPLWAARSAGQSKTPIAPSTRKRVRASMTLPGKAEVAKKGVAQQCITTTDPGLHRRLPRLLRGHRHRGVWMRFAVLLVCCATCVLAACAD